MFVIISGSRSKSRSYAIGTVVDGRASSLAFASRRMVSSRSPSLGAYLSNSVLAAATALRALYCRARCKGSLVPRASVRLPLVGQAACNSDGFEPVSP